MFEQRLGGESDVTLQRPGARATQAVGRAKRGPEDGNLPGEYEEGHEGAGAE